MGKKIKKCLINIWIITIFLTCVMSFRINPSKSTQTNYIEYYLKVYKANSLYNKKDYSRCFDILNNLFRDYEPLNQELYYEYEKYIKSAFLIGKNIDYKKSVSKLIQDFGYEKKVFNGEYKDSILAKAYTKSNLTAIDFEVLRNNYIKTKNFTLRDTIIEINKADQLYRHGNDYYKYQKEIDSIENINGEKLLYIFKKYGFPNDQIIGNRTIRGKRESTMIDAVLIHMASNKNVSLFKKELMSFVKQGKCSPYFYASLIDRECLNNQKKQIYYTFQKKETLSSEYINEINANRKQIGLEPYKQ